MILTTNKDDLQLIERFFERELTEDELAYFKERLDADTNFAEQVARFDYARQEVEAIYYPDEEKNFKQKWKKVLQTPQRQTIKRKSIPYYLMRVAAVLIFVIGLIGIGRYIGMQENNLQQLALQNWEKSEKDMGNGAWRGKLIDRDVIWDNAEKSYTENRFEKTLNSLSILGDEPDALLWKGICHFELRQMPTALWYQALAYLYENNTEAARKNLNLIVENTYPKANDAKELLEQL